MKTSTLIVRLVGLYLLVSFTVAIIELQKMTANIPSIQFGQLPVLGNFRAYSWIGIIVGLAATIFAGPLAHVLTFDSEPRERHSDLSDSLLGR